MGQQIRGFSLLEVLVALVIVSIGLFGLLKLASITVALSQNSLWRAIAQNEALNAYQIIQAQQVAALSLWQQELALLLPQAQADVTAEHIKIIWHQPQHRQLILSYR